MAVTNFVPELWNAAILTAYEKAAVFTQPTVSNTEYEGAIKAMGDTVHVTSLADPTIRTYSKTADLTVEDLSDSDTAIVIDQGDYYAFRVNDVDKVQAAGDFQGPALDRAGQLMADKIDLFLSKLFYSGVAAGNKVGRVTVVNNDGGKPGSGQSTAYSVLVQLRTKLDKAGVPLPGRYVVVEPDFISALSFDSRFNQVANAGTDETLRNGLVGRCQGFDVLVSNNVVTPGTSANPSAGADINDRVIVAGVPGATSRATQITESEAIRDPNRFADIVRGLQVYGAKIFRPTGVATATVTYSAGTG